MVGGGFFRISCDEGVYSVGAYNRDFFDQPLGHVVQYCAIEEMKNRGIRWYKIGLRHYPTEVPSPTDKEIQIGEFKQGFASHLFPRFLLKHETKYKQKYQLCFLVFLKPPNKFRSKKVHYSKFSYVFPKTILQFNEINISVLVSLIALNQCQFLHFGLKTKVHLFEYRKL